MVECAHLIVMNTLVIINVYEIRVIFYWRRSYFLSWPNIWSYDTVLLQLSVFFSSFNLLFKLHQPTISTHFLNIRGICSAAGYISTLIFLTQHSFAGISFFTNWQQPYTIQPPTEEVRLRLTSLEESGGATSECWASEGLWHHGSRQWHWMGTPHIDGPVQSAAKD